MNYDDLYAPLLTDAEISQINAEREERAAAAIAAQREWHDATFGGCGCIAALPKCNCGLESWIEPSRAKPVKPVDQDLPLSGRNLLVGTIAVALSAYVSSFFQWGFAS